MVVAVGILGMAGRTWDMGHGKFKTSTLMGILGKSPLPVFLAMLSSHQSWLLEKSVRVCVWKMFLLSLSCVPDPSGKKTQLLTSVPSLPEKVPRPLLSQECHQHAKSLPLNCQKELCSFSPFPKRPTHGVPESAAAGRKVEGEIMVPGLSFLSTANSSKNGYA